MTRVLRAGDEGVRIYPANGHGLDDIIGDVWGWRTTSAGAPPGSGCIPTVPCDDLIILKGGSFLCAAEYCQRCRPAARIAVTADFTAAHIGFRLAGDAANDTSSVINRGQG